MAIQSNESFGLMTQAIVAKYELNPTSDLAFTSMMGRDVTDAASVGVSTRKNNKLVSSDIIRGARGTRNASSKSAIDIFIPPFYDEWYDLTQLEGYDKMASTLVPDETFIARTAKKAMKMTDTCKGKEQRAIEKQWLQVMKTGIVELVSGDDLNFNRSADSMVNVGLSDSAKYWDKASATIIDNIRVGCERIRKIGGAPGSIINLITSSKGIQTIISSDEIKDIADNRRLNLVNITMPKGAEMITGLTFHGTLAAGTFTVNLFSYDETYTNDSGSDVRYMDENQCILLPDFPFLKANMTTAFGALPVIYEGDKGASIRYQPIDFQVSDIVDEDAATHKVHVKSAPLAIPVALDCIYNMQILA